MCGREVTYNREIHNLMVGGRYYVAVENYIHETYVQGATITSYESCMILDQEILSEDPQEIEYSWIV